tara:strand:- start:1340 stop:1702 length:363 start_codon:yes stop_codon:yes gene_type:complete
MLRYFEYSEFDSPDLPGSGKMYMDLVFLEILDQVRFMFCEPIYINSGYRTKKHNDSLPNSSPDSSHLKGLAVDIKCTNSRDRYTLINLFITHKVTRFGISKNFLHVDMDKSKAQNLIWTY